ncbi:hypothetical protein AVEN_143587-1 [Araneus ventricosus]|uniref:Uncharacterized protein n=1 Tax=Araneus ventricosus TaxID=182803 RepID=A0A4Y2AMY5_ARAVE|nr:hypothetical protein AVEN_143587-1 [Araneus ventricosus]
MRSLALRRLVSARNENRGSSEVRIFQVPKIDFKASDYFALINWQRVEHFEPPLLMNVPFKEIEATKRKPVPMAREFVGWLQHSEETSVNDRKVKRSGQRPQYSSYGQLYNVSVNEVRSLRFL